MKVKKNTHPGIWIFVVLLFALGCWMIWNAQQCMNTEKESFTWESNPYNSRRCALSYRLYDDGNLQLPAGRDRCQAVCGKKRKVSDTSNMDDFDFTGYEYYCPHNCREFGVSICDQGRMM